MSAQVGVGAHHDRCVDPFEQRQVAARIGIKHALAEAVANRDAAGADAAALIASAELELAAAEAARNTLARLQMENSAYEQRMELYRGAVPWPWVVGALVVVLGAGFAGGWWWLDALIRRRHGGFRLY